MGRLAVEYATDMAPFASMSLPQVQELVRNIPYVRDPEGEEAVHRPWITLNGYGIGRDCDDKAVCIGAWAVLQGWSFKFLAAGNGDGKTSPAFCHVFAVLQVPGMGWTWVDATYDYDRIGTHKPYKNQRVIFSRN